VCYIAAQNVKTGQWNDGGDRSINGNGERGLGHWGRGTGAIATDQCCNSNCNGNGNNRSIMFVSQRKTPTIVVVENVQNVWLTNIPDVLRFD
jgi:hypothetical protein